MPNATVKSTNPTDLNVSAHYNEKDLPDSLLQNLKENKTVAFLVLKNDSLVYEWYKNGYSAKKRTNVFSVTKSIMSILVGIALKEGKIKSLDEPISNYYTEFKEGERSKITFKHLLQMSSGLNYYDSYKNPFGPSGQLYYSRDVRKVTNELQSEKEAGIEWRYKNCDPQVLAFALEKAVGMPLDKYAAEKLWSPLGASQEALWTKDRKKGNLKTYCCFNTNARDIARLGILYKNGGNWNGKQLVDSAYVKASLTPANIKRTNGTQMMNYGYAWWLPQMEGSKVKTFAAEGMLGQFCIVVPEKNLVIVRFGKKPSKIERFRKMYKYSVMSCCNIWG